jgi:hypothetical protein
MDSARDPRFSTAKSPFSSEPAGAHNRRGAPVVRTSDVQHLFVLQPENGRKCLYINQISDFDPLLTCRPELSAGFISHQQRHGLGLARFRMISGPVIFTWDQKIATTKAIPPSST